VTTVVMMPLLLLLRPTNAPRPAPGEGAVEH